ncbi:hypothetical protein MNQ95_04395 [Pseudoxanthomonas daejeonensis]|uniref:hypothetical protein n=1 Tax=Pseudoxanthomonas daejeonensis TaxID=266062 RepID=UPI001F5444E5|nr:hypothetical protein [Pseudoxanthomonas daejeonensis]UNK58346.1 hypothetical protein MNQ95_04395 [Pseudoxanthomonas daejeonensis]
MTGLALTRAPPAPRPLRFLLTAPLWGVVAGVLLAASPDTLAGGRWSPTAVALVHLFTLGVLGNAMLGSLLQFLPVAAGIAPSAARLAPVAHVALNLGLPVFVAALFFNHALLLPASLLLAASLLLVIVPPLPALLRAGAQRLLRAGIGGALLALLATIALGLLAALVLGGHAALPLDQVVDAHATLGAGGWMLGLLAAVGSVTVPMFQGTSPVPPRAFAAWLVLALGLPIAWGLARLAGAPVLYAALSLALPAMAFAAALLWLQWRAPHRRNRTLVRFWCVGSIALALAGIAACASAAGAPAITTALAGMLALGIGVPLLVTGMLLEITAFITWIALRGQCPRGVRIPAVGRLVTDGEKHGVLCVHLAAAGLLLVALAWPPLGRIAGIALAVAYAGSALCQWRCLQRARAFARQHGEPQ